MKFRVGDWVEVRSKEEILRTLDSNGQFEGMQFMPQMFQYCGKRFMVYKSAHKTCDTVNPVRALRIPNAVHLDLRCDGQAYEGCQAACLIFWKTEWLTLLEGGTSGKLSNNPGLEKGESISASSCTEMDVWNARVNHNTSAADGVHYRCQATQMPLCGTALPWWDVRQYWDDYMSGNVSMGQVIRSLLFASYSYLVQLGIGLGPPLRWMYDRIQDLWGGIPYPGRRGIIPLDQPTPGGELNLQPGELVRVKSFEKIRATLNTENKNRGLYFDAEMVPFCGRTYRVKDKLHRFVDEKTGRLVTLKSPSIILEDVWCQSRYSGCRTFCPRSIYTWWREIWLERLPGNPPHPSESTGKNVCRKV